MGRWIWGAVGALALLLVGSPSALASPPNQADGSAWVTSQRARDIATAGNTTYIADPGTVAPRRGSALEFDKSTNAELGFPQFAGGGVYAVVPDGSGGWYVGGDFDRVAGAVRYGLAHVRGDGSVDPAFPQLGHEPISVFNTNESVESLALSADGHTLYVGGFFDQVGGQSRTGIASIATSTDTVTSWAPQLTGSFPQVTQVVLGAGTTAGWVFIGGPFTGVGAVSAPNVAKVSVITGGADGSFDPDPTSGGNSSNAAI